MNSDLLNHGIIGTSPPIVFLRSRITAAALTDLTVLITGESGTGKELIARAIHEQSSRAKQPFVCVNCGALPEALLESELFGYARGAFTGAIQKQKGLFQAAHTGTIFLDEIGELSNACQVKLLRVLQENTVRPLGEHVEIPIDVRVITATNRNLADEIALGRFREDLFYRIAVLTIDSPSLRERAADIPLLVEYFLTEAKRRTKRNGAQQIDDDAMRALCFYAWPGNVRQLQNVVERLLANSSSGVIGAAETREALTSAGPCSQSYPQIPMMLNENESLDDFLDRVLLGLYHHVRALSGSHSRAAQVLRTDRVSLYQRLKRARKRIENHEIYQNGDWQRPRDLGART